MWQRFSIPLVGLLLGSVAAGQDVIEPEELPWGSLRTLSQRELPEATGPDLSSIATVTGRVLDPDGKPAAGAGLSIRIAVRELIADFDDKLGGYPVTGSIAEQEDHTGPWLTTKTNDHGEFQVKNFRPHMEHEDADLVLVVIHQRGYAICSMGDPEPLREIRLLPYGRLEATFANWVVPYREDRRVAWVSRPVVRDAKSGAAYQIDLMQDESVDTEGHVVFPKAIPAFGYLAVFDEPVPEEGSYYSPGRQNRSVRLESAELGQLGFDSRLIKAVWLKASRVTGVTRPEEDLQHSPVRFPDREPKREYVFYVRNAQGVPLPDVSVSAYFGVPPLEKDLHNMAPEDQEDYREQLEEATAAYKSTGDSGIVRLEGPAGISCVCVAARGYPWSWLPVNECSPPSADPIVITLHKPPVIGGTILKPDGTPLDNCSIEIGGAPGQICRCSEATDDNGHWRTTELRSGSPWPCLFILPLYEDCRLYVEESPDMEELLSEEHKVVLRRIVEPQTVPVRVLIRGLTRRDDPDVTAFRHKRGETLDIDSISRTNWFMERVDEGVISLDGKLDPGPTLIRVSCRGYATQIRRVNVRPDMAPLEFTLQSVPDTVLRVVDAADGQPVSRAKIEAVWHGEGSQPKSLCEEERTSQLGLCVLSNLPKGNITCRVSKRGYEPQEFALPSTLEEHVVELKRKTPRSE